MTESTQAQTQLDTLLDLGDAMIARIITKVSTIQESFAGVQTRIEAQNNLLHSIGISLNGIAPDPVAEQKDDDGEQEFIEQMDASDAIDATYLQEDLSRDPAL